MPIGSALRDRRRRVLLDENRESETTSAKAKSARRRTVKSKDESRTYTEAALVDQHLPVSILLPKSIGILVAIFVGIVLMMIGVNAFNHWSQAFADHFSGQQLMAFDLTAGRGIAKWCASFLLIFTAMNSFQIFLLRRHHNDDYQGTYRLWFWLTGVFLMLSLNATAELHHLLFDFSYSQARQYLGISNRAHWLGIVAIPLLLFFIRLGIEMYHSRAATTSLFAALTGIAIAIASDQQWLPPVDGVHRSVFESNLMLIGYCSLFYSTVCYGRYVYLDSQGLLTELHQRRAERILARQMQREERETKRAEQKDALQKEREAKATKKRESKSDTKTKSKSKTASNKSTTSRKQTSTSSRSSKSDESKSESKKTTGSSRSKAKTAKRKSTQSKANKSRKKTTSKTDDAQSSRTIPEFDSRSGNSSAQPATLSIEEMQEQLRKAKSRSERKRIKKMIDAQNSRRAA